MTLLCFQTRGDIQGAFIHCREIPLSNEKCAFFGCRPAPGNGGTVNTAVVVRLVFSSSVQLAQLPSADEVAQTLVDAVSSPNSTFNVSIVPDSVGVLGE